MILQQIIHYSLHFLAPGLIAYLFFRDHWKMAWILMVLTMLIDLDHLTAIPIYDSFRCSIGFHPLHSYTAIAIYIALFLFRKSRIISVGLIWHIFTDFFDCILMEIS
jgi:hypothetical protein